MSSAYRVSLCLLALSLGLINSSLAQPQPSPSSPASPQSSAESAARAVAEKYFALYAAEDVDRVMSLWSEKSPDNASYKQNLQRQFATADLSVSDAVISRVKVENEKARLRAMANLTAINRKSNKKREQRLVRDFAFVKEDGQWKVWRSVPAEDKLAAALVKAKTEAERAELLAEEKELVTAELARALTGQGDQFANRREYPQARGRVGAGEGMIGLSWAMFIAGVPSIVVSQWKVESAGTRDLISQPVAGKAKQTKTEALRQAALKLMMNPETRHPFYWAGFVLVGDAR